MVSFNYFAPSYFCTEKGPAAAVSWRRCVGVDTPPHGPTSWADVWVKNAEILFRFTIAARCVGCILLVFMLIRRCGVQTLSCFIWNYQYCPYEILNFFQKKFGVFGIVCIFAVWICNDYLYKFTNYKLNNNKLNIKQL